MTTHRSMLLICHKRNDQHAWDISFIHLFNDSLAILSSDCCKYFSVHE